MMANQRDRSLFASLVSDSLVLMHLIRGQRGADLTHEERLERFYAPQASRYDQFRERLLHGRREILERLAPPPGSRVIELGGGTGRNVEFLGARMLSLERFEIVDICPSLLRHAQERCRRWPDVAHAVQADVTTYRPEAPADVVLFSYSLTMIPDWRGALRNAMSMLRPGGMIGVVDFHLPADSQPRHHRLSQWFWRNWFAHDGVHLSAEHLPALRSMAEPLFAESRRGNIPYLPGLQAPYYLFIGRKPAGSDGLAPSSIRHAPFTHS